MNKFGHFIIGLLGLAIVLVMEFTVACFAGLAITFGINILLIGTLAGTGTYAPVIVAFNCAMYLGLRTWGGRDLFGGTRGERSTIVAFLVTLLAAVNWGMAIWGREFALFLTGEEYTLTSTLVTLYAAAIAVLTLVMVIEDRLAGSHKFHRKESLQIQ